MQPAHDVRAHPAETDHAQLHGPTLYPRKRGASRPEEARARVRPEPDSSSCSSGVGVRAVDAIELHEAEGALERIESWLRERGFFAPGGEDLMADLYLGYGLSSTIRRRHSPLPPEPCPLPFAACAVRQSPPAVERDDGATEAIRFGPWQPTWGAASYGEVVERVREAIARGDVYQVNLVQHLSATFAGDPGTVAARLGRLKPRHPEPYRGSDWSVVSAIGLRVAWLQASQPGGDRAGVAGEVRRKVLYEVDLVDVTSSDCVANPPDRLAVGAGSHVGCHRPKRTVSP